jgi:N-acetylglutamate synthase-like GNAT family acetyltransferase
VAIVFCLIDFDCASKLKKQAKSDGVTIANHQNQMYWGYFFGEDIVACAAVHTVKSVAILKSAFVLPEYRKNGIGKLMVDLRIEYCKLNGFKKLKTISLKPELYLKIGFKFIKSNNTKYGIVHHMELEL